VQLLQEHPGSIAFNGLRRSLKAHPESLTRALRRLERYGVVEHAPTGYRLTGAPGGPEGPPPSEPSGAPELRWIPVAEVALAPATDPKALLGLLAGRWAGSLRWVGIYDRAEDPLLVWSRRDGPGQVLLSVRSGRLRVYSELPGSSPEATEGVNAAARELLAFALERVRAGTSEPAHQRLVTFGPIRNAYGTLPN
jgi:hypothetical protein